MTDEEALKALKKHFEVMEVTLSMRAARENEYAYPSELEAIEMAISALRERIARQNPQPLTLDELRGMGKKAYWHKSLQSDNDHWSILPEYIAQNPENYHYAERWIAYRTEPEPPKGGKI